VALVINNGAYEHAPRLSTLRIPILDAIRGRTAPRALPHLRRVPGSQLKRHLKGRTLVRHPDVLRLSHNWGRLPRPISAAAVALAYAGLRQSFL